MRDDESEAVQLVREAAIAFAMHDGERAAHFDERAWLERARRLLGAGEQASAAETPAEGASAPG